MIRLFLWENDMPISRILSALFIASAAILCSGYDASAFNLSSKNEPAIRPAANSIKDGDSSAKSAENYILLASNFRKNGDPAQAVELMREAQVREPANEKVLAHLGYALIAAKQYEDAVDVFDMLSAINHKNIAGYNGKAVAFDNAGNHAAAQEIYQKALKLQPSSPTIINNLALSLILNNQPSSAIALLEPLSTQKNAPNTTRANLALAYAIQGDLKQSKLINLADMSPEQANENQRFYEHYSQMVKKQQLEAITPQMQAALPSAMDKDDSEPVELKPAAGDAKKNFVPLPAEDNATASDGKFLGYEALHIYPTR